MKIRIIAVVMCLAIGSWGLGCSTIMEEHRGAAVGAGAGGAVGGVAGAVIGHGAGAVVAGALIGALVGGAIGYFAYDQQRTRQQTASVYKYEGSQGIILTIENAYATPASVRPGDVVDLKMTYAVLTPSSGTMVNITEVREITYRGSLVGRPEVRVEHSGGTYSSNVPLKLPATAAKGTYQVKLIVQSENAKDMKETSFMVN